VTISAFCLQRQDVCVSIAIVQKVPSFPHQRTRKGVDAAHVTSETLQFIDSVMENIKVKQRALQALLASTAFAEVKERAAAAAVEGNKVCPQVDQIALFKIGQFTDNSWNVLRCALKDKVNLAAPSTLRRVRF
jgi:hypothetical protein